GRSGSMGWWFAAWLRGRQRAALPTLAMFGGRLPRQIFSAVRRRSCALFRQPLAKQAYKPPSFFTRWILLFTLYSYLALLSIYRSVLRKRGSWARATTSWAELSMARTMTVPSSASRW